MDIDCRPAYYAVRKPNTGLDDCAYVPLRMNWSSFRSQPGQEVPVNAPNQYKRCMVIVYATKDNQITAFTTNILASILINRFNLRWNNGSWFQRLSVNIISSQHLANGETDLRWTYRRCPFPPFLISVFHKINQYARSSQNKCVMPPNKNGYNTTLWGAKDKSSNR